MLSASDTNVTDTLRLFTQRGVDVAALVPTAVGIEKAIMDATSPIRDFLRRSGVHDYDEQLQGPSHKAAVRAYFVLDDRLVETQASLYRPRTKFGDPRIWFRGLKKFARPWNLLVLVVNAGEIYVVNCSDEDVLSSLESPESPLGRIVSRAASRKSPAATELLAVLKDISACGYLPTVTPGDTGVGMTLESAIGISPNASKSPDFKGIELKASRRRIAGRRNRVNLFAQVPDWSISKLKSSREVLDTYGYYRGPEFRLYCTVHSRAPNSQGLFLHVAFDDDVLSELSESNGSYEEVVRWQMSTLRGRLAQKHPETFWISADARGAGSSEEFHYVNAVHTRGPNVGALAVLLDDGRVTLDHAIKRDSTGKVREKGPFFKIRPEDFGDIFPPPSVYDLQAA